MPGPGGHHGGMYGGPRPHDFGGMHHHRPYRGGCFGCVVPTLALAFAGIAGILVFLF